jgi:hypothetical protein
VTELLSTWALPFKGHRRDSREVAGLKGVETIIEDRGKLTGLWLHQPARSERPRPSVRLSVETDGTDLPAFLAVWEPVLCSVRRHD